MENRAHGVPRGQWPRVARRRSSHGGRVSARHGETAAGAGAVPASAVRTEHGELGAVSVLRRAGDLPLHGASLGGVR